MPNVGAGMIKVAPPIIVSAKADEGDGKKVYIGPRKVDEAPQATFHYGDGKWLMQFTYTKSSKASARGGVAHGGANIPQDKSKVIKTVVKNGMGPATVK
jgi:hypothetical protein